MGVCYPEERNVRIPCALAKISYPNIPAHSGLNIIFTDDIVGDGKVDLNSNRIYIKATQKSRTYEMALIHELTHRLYNKKNGEVLLGAKGLAKYFSAEEKENIRKKYTEFYHSRGETVSSIIIADEQQAAYAEKTLSNKNVLERLVADKPTIKEKILNFFKGAKSDYEGDAKLSRAAEKLYKQYKKLFDEFSAQNYQTNAATADDYGGFILDENGNVIKETKPTNAKQVKARAKTKKESNTRFSLEEKEEAQAVVDKVKNAIPELSKMEAVANLKGDEFPKSDNPKIRASDQVIKEYKKLGEKVERPNFGTVLIDKDGVMADVAHGLGRAKVIAFAAVPQVIQDGQQIDYQQNWKNRGYDTYIFAAPVKVGTGKNITTNYVGVVVIKGDNNQLYLHEVVDENGNIIKTSASKQIKATSAAETQVTGKLKALVDNSISETEEKSNSKTKKSSKKVRYALSEEQEQALTDRGIEGDELLNAIDLSDEIQSVGGKITQDAKAVLFHATTAENAKKIIESGKMYGKEPNLYFSTKSDGEILGYGDTVIQAEIPLEKLEVNDVFDKEIHLTMAVKPYQLTNIRYALPTTDSDGRKLTEQQQDYFKDSKVRDKDGNLLTLYHGTASDFNIYDLDKTGATNDRTSHLGFWFTPKKAVAENFAEFNSNEYDGKKASVKEVYLNLTNPKIYDTVDNTEKIAELQSTIEQTKKDITERKNKLRDLVGKSVYNRYFSSEYSRDDTDIGYRTGANYYITYLGIAPDAAYSAHKLTEEITRLRKDNDIAHQQLRYLQDSDPFLQMTDDLDEYMEWITSGHNHERGFGRQGYMSLNARQAAADFRAKLIKEGYDGIWIKNTRVDQAGDQIVAFRSNQIKYVTNENPTTNDDIRLALPEVDPVEPTSNAWKPTIDTYEAKARFPSLWDVTADSSEVRNPTQISSTVKTYRKIYDYLKRNNFDGTILDASSGLGYGTKAGIEEYGFKVDDIEPYPDASYKPKYTDYSTLNKKYDVIISNAVLNVLPQDQRDALVIKMGELLKDGGTMFINVRGEDVNTLSSNADNVKISEREWFVASTGSYQKGFTKNELVAYLRDALGDNYTVEKASFFGGVAVTVTKNASTENSNVRYALPETLNKLGDYDSVRAERITSRSGDTISRNYEEIISFIKNAKSGAPDTRLHIGIINNDTAALVKEKTGIDIANYEFVLSSSNIVHLFNRHGKSTESLSGQIQVTYDNIENIIEAVIDPENVYLDTDNSGNYAMVFEKSVNGKNLAITVVSTKKSALTLKSARIMKSSKNTPSANAYARASTSETNSRQLTDSENTPSANAEARARTSETNSRQLATNSISDIEEKSNTKTKKSSKNIRYALPEDTDLWSEDTDGRTDAERAQILGNARETIQDYTVERTYTRTEVEQIINTAVAYTLDPETSEFSAYIEDSTKAEAIEKLWNGINSAKTPEQAASLIKGTASDFNIYDLDKTGATNDRTSQVYKNNFEIILICTAAAAICRGGGAFY